MDIRWPSVSFIAFCCLLGCQTNNRYEHYERLVGKWEIVTIESRAEKVALEELLESNQLTTQPCDD